MERMIVSLLLVVALLHGQEQVTFSSSAPPAPSSVGASAFGARGGATLYYWVVARYPGGASSPSMAMAFSTVGAGNLTGSNYVRVSWAPAAGATGYDVLRSDTPMFPGPTCAACAVVLNTASTSVDDNGGAMSAYPPGGLQTAVPVTASFTINNRDGAVPYLNLQLLSIRLNEVLRVGLISGTPAEDDCLKYAAGRIVSAGAACGSGGGGTAITAAATSGATERIPIASGDSRAATWSQCTSPGGTSIACPGGLASGGPDPGALRLEEQEISGVDYIDILAPDSITTTYRLKLPTVPPAAQQVLVQGTPSGSPSTSQATWGDTLLRNAQNPNGYFDWTLGSAPGNPAAGDLRVYPKTGGGLCTRDSAGTEVCPGSGPVAAAGMGGVSTLPIGMDFSSNSPVVAGGMKLVQINVAVGFVLNKFMFRVNTAAAGETAYFALYNSACNTKLTEASASVASTGAITASTAGDYFVAPGHYWVGVDGSTTSVFVGGVALGTGGSTLAYLGTNNWFTQSNQKVAAGVMPASCGTLSDPVAPTAPMVRLGN